MSLSEWANLQGVHPQTAYRRFREGTLPIPACKMGRLILIGDLATPNPRVGITALYARVSSGDQRTDLDRQVARVSTRATAHGYLIGRVVTEVDSGLNGNRKKPRVLLAGPTVKAIVVEHRERRERFDSEYVAASLEAHGRSLIVIDEVEVDDDLVGDRTEVLTSFCARLDTNRAVANRVTIALAAAQRLSDVA
jgi:predicted site-specific integrase-resolvase